MRRPGSDPSIELCLGEVHLWLFDPPTVEAYADEGAGWLSIDERLRAEVFPREIDRRRYRGRRALLRSLLARYTGSRPEALPLQAKCSGKPYLAGDLEAPQFSLSASHGWLLLAVCDDQAIGADLELVQRGFESSGIARSFFDPAELILLETARAEERDALFFRAWTRAEAFLKMTGRGLPGLESLAILRRRAVWARDLRLPQGLAGALCLGSSPTKVRWMAYPGLEEGQAAIEDGGLALAPLQFLEG